MASQRQASHPAFAARCAHRRPRDRHRPFRPQQQHSRHRDQFAHTHTEAPAECPTDPSGTRRITTPSPVGNAHRTGAPPSHCHIRVDASRRTEVGNLATHHPPAEFGGNSDTADIPPTRPTVHGLATPDSPGWHFDLVCSNLPPLPHLTGEPNRSRCATVRLRTAPKARRCVSSDRGKSGHNPYYRALPTRFAGHIATTIPDSGPQLVPRATGRAGTWFPKYRLSQPTSRRDDRI